MVQVYQNCALMNNTWKWLEQGIAFMLCAVSITRASDLYHNTKFTTNSKVYRSEHISTQNNSNFRRWQPISWATSPDTFTENDCVITDIQKRNISRQHRQKNRKYLTHCECGKAYIWQTAWTIEVCC